MKVVTILPACSASSREPVGVRLERLSSALARWGEQMRLEREEVAHLGRMNVRELGDIGLVRIEGAERPRIVSDRDHA